MVLRKCKQKKFNGKKCNFFLRGRGFEGAALPPLSLSSALLQPMCKRGCSFFCENGGFTTKILGTLYFHSGVRNPSSIFLKNRQH